MNINIDIRIAIPLLCWALATAALAAADREPVLMGYDKLDAKGVPENVQVALSRARLTQLWQRAHPEAEKVPSVCALATGAAQYRLALADKSLAGELSLPLAVLSEDWQQLRIPIVPGSVRGVRAVLFEDAPVAGIPLGPKRLAWTSDDAVLTVSLEGRQQCRLIVELSLPVEELVGGGRARLALLAGRGGSAEVVVPTAWELVAEGLELLPPPPGGTARTWHVDLPPGSAALALSWRLPAQDSASDGSLGLDQRLSVTLAAGRLEWRDALTFTVQGRPLQQASVTVPKGVVVTAVDGGGLASWQQQGTALVLVWNKPQAASATVVASGFVAVDAETRSALVVPALPGSRRSTGRLALVHGAERHFLLPADKAVERTNPAAGESLAVRWLDQPEALAVAWEPLVDELKLNQKIALIAGLDRVHATVQLALHGRGQVDALRLRLAEPWRLKPQQQLPADLSIAWTGAGGERVLVLRLHQPWRDGSALTLALEADRREVVAEGSGAFTAPDLLPLGDAGVAGEVQDWVLGDAGDRQLRVADPETYAKATIEALAPGLSTALAAGERWRAALQRRQQPPLALILGRDAPQLQITASHYLVLGLERVRWYARLVYQLDQGEVRELRCTVPAGAKLLRLSAPDLGSWRREGDEVVAVLAAPSRQPVALDLSLEVAVEAGAAKLRAIGLPAGAVPGAQAVALVEADEDGLLRLDGDGLEALAKPGVELAVLANSAAGLPRGIDAKGVRHAWRAARADWSLALRREPLATATGPDGIATLLDVVTVLAADGSLRGRCTWHVLNQSRQQIPLSLPGGAELWEVRVNGRVVRARRDGDHGDRLLVPVRPLRSGEAATAIQVTWYQPVEAALLAGTAFTPKLPTLDGLRTVQALWRVVPPQGYRLEKTDGTMIAVPAGAADAGRARRVIEELGRLRTHGADLGEAGYHRLGDELAALDVELSDYLVGMERQGGGGEVPEEARRVRAQVRDELHQLEVSLKERQDRRHALGLDQDDQDWLPLARPALPSDEFLPRLQPKVRPWSDALALTAAANLGPGQPPVGWRHATSGNLLGLDLIHGDDRAGLTFQQAGKDLDLVLRLRRQPQPWWPWLAAIGAIAALVAGVRGRR